MELMERIDREMISLKYIKFSTLCDVLNIDSGVWQNFCSDKPFYWFYELAEKVPELSTYKEKLEVSLIVLVEPEALNINPFFN
jgi:hypothetical protein